MNESTIKENLSSCFSFGLARQRIIYGFLGSLRKQGV